MNEKLEIIAPRLDGEILRLPAHAAQRRDDLFSYKPTVQQEKIQAIAQAYGAVGIV